MNKQFSSVDVVRRENVKRLMSDTSTTRKQLSEGAGINYGLLGHYIGKNPTKAIGDETAEKIEVFFNKPRYWLDHEHNGEIYETSIEAKVIHRLFAGGADRSSMIAVPMYDAKLACGDGYANGDAVDNLGYFELSEEFLMEKGLPKDGRGLILVKANGESMSPSIPHDTPLLINTLETDYDAICSGKVYAFNVGGELICKRVYRNLGGSLTLRSDNNDKSTYPDKDVNKDTFDSFNLFGRVKYAFVEM